MIGSPHRLAQHNRQQQALGEVSLVAQQLHCHPLSRLQTVQGAVCLTESQVLPNPRHSQLLLSSPQAKPSRNRTLSDLSLNPQNQMPRVQQAEQVACSRPLLLSSSRALACLALQAKPQIPNRQHHLSSRLNHRHSLASNRRNRSTVSRALWPPSHPSQPSSIVS